MPETKTKPKKPAARPPKNKLQQRFRIRQTIEARLLGVSTKTASTLRRGKKPSPQVARRLTELNRLLHALAEIVKEDVVAEWLETPSEVLDGLKPLELIERGEVDRIWQIIYALRSGEPT